MAVNLGGHPRAIGALAIAALTTFAGRTIAAEPQQPRIINPPAQHGELARWLWYDADLTLHLRTYYLDRSVPRGPGPAAWAGGGWLGYRSGWLGDVFRFGVVGYTSLPLWAPIERDGSLLLKPGQDGYGVIGEAYGQVKLFDQTFTGFRQRLNEPEVNPRDIRMTPNTFEAYTLQGKFGDFNYLAGYVHKIKPINQDTFEDMAVQAGAPVGVREGMWLGTLGYNPNKAVTARLSSYLVADILSSNYADVSWVPPLDTDAFQLKLGAQFMYQSSNGDNLLTGSSFNTWSVGHKADLTIGPVTGTLAYNQTDDSAFYRTPYGSWAGYTSMIVKDFNRAGERAFLIGASVDFATLNLPGLSFFTNYVIGRDAVDPDTKQALSDNTEFDFTLDYRFTAEQWPTYLRPLAIRLRAAHIEEKFNGSTDVTNDYRVIANYEWVFNTR